MLLKTLHLRFKTRGETLITISLSPFFSLQNHETFSLDPDSDLRNVNILSTHCASTLCIQPDVQSDPIRDRTDSVDPR